MADPEAVKTSAMDNPSVAVEPTEAIDYSEAAGDIITDMPVAGPGDMPIERQTDTFRGFMSISRYSAAIIILVVFWSTILYGMDGAPWLTAFSTLGLGLALGAGLKLRGAYYPVIIVATIVLGLIGIFAPGGPDVPEPTEIAALL